MGQKIVLSDTTFTDATLPILYDDALMSSGSLFLFDPTHSLGGFTTPLADGIAVPNVAWKAAATILGAGTQTSLMGLYRRNFAGPTESKDERSGKGGIHVINSQTNQSTVSNYGFVTPPGAIQDYLFANVPAHSIYMSVWWRLTRAQLAGSTAPCPMLNMAQNTSNFFVHLQGGQLFPSSGAPFVGGDSSNPSTNTTATVAPAPMYRSIAANNWTGTKPGSLTNHGIDNSSFGLHFGVGSNDAWVAAFNQNRSPSAIICRCYVEDLTVSGRTFAAVDAIDLSMYNAAFSSGGKYFGDTWTSPAGY